MPHAYSSRIIDFAGTSLPWARIILVLAGLANAIASPAARAADGPTPTVIVFDGSGSMWGKLEGDKRPKFEVARDAVKATLAKVPATVPYGFMSFGHRRSGDCSDIQLIQPIGPGDPARLTPILDKLNPRGKGPIAQSLREAAKALAGGPGNVVLIHDNADNCRQDMCEAANEITAANAALKVNVVSIALDAEERQRMDCVVKPNGGRIFEANDSESLATAIDGALTLAMLGPRQPAAQAAQPAPGSRPDKPAGTPAAVLPPLPNITGLALSARLARDAAPLDAPVRWTVRKGSSVVFEGTGPSPIVPAAAGAYVIEASLGLVTATVKAEVAGPPATAVPVSLEAASLRVSVRDTKDGAISPTALVSVLRGEPAKPSEPVRPLWIGRAAEADFVLPAGSYKIAIMDGRISREETISVAPGAVIARDVVTGAGRMEITSVARIDGPPLENATVLLSRDDPDAPDGRREIARSAAPNPAFVLPAGTYYVTVRSGAVSVRERIAVGAGDNVKRTIALTHATLAVQPSGMLPKLAAAPDQSQVTARLAIKTRVLALEGGKEREVARSTAEAPVFQLPPGRYRVEIVAGTHNARATQDIDLDAQANRKITPRLDAQLVTLRAAGAPPDVAYEVRDGSGKLVTRTLDPAPSLVLSPGRYQIRAESRERVATGVLDVVASTDPQSIELAFK